MHIYILNLTNSSLFFLKILTKFGLKFYYLKENIKNQDKLKNLKNILPIKFDNRNLKSKRLLRYYTFGEQKETYNQSSKYISLKIIKNLKKDFSNIKNLKEKLRVSILSLFDYQSIGVIYIFNNLVYENSRIFIIHNSFKTFVFKENGVNTRATHFYYPLDDFCIILDYIIKIFSNLKNFKFFKIQISPKKKVSDLITNNSPKTGIIFHQSIIWGENQYKKYHYFSSKKKSPLNIKNVSLFLIDGSSEKIYQKDSKIEFIKSKFQFKYFIFSIISFLKNIIHVRSIKELTGLLIISILLNKFYSWKSFFRGKNVSNIIYDYDVLLSKSLSLALESLKIKTIAIQERTLMSYASMYSCIVNTYLYAGKLPKKFGEKNKSLIHENSFNLGLWRVSYFYSRELVNLKKISYKSFNKLNPFTFKKNILFVGYFRKPKNDKPYMNQIALDDFLEYIMLFSEKFPDSSLILRMKSIKKIDVEYIMKKLKNIPNFYICDDFRYEAVSYRLCKESNLIISLPSTLAEESITYGKKVLFINDLYPIAKMTEDTYPKEYHFAIPKNKKDLIALAKKCLENDPSVNQKFSKLKELIKGDIDLSQKNNISNTLEKFLQ